MKGHTGQSTQPPVCSWLTQGGWQQKKLGLKLVGLEGNRNYFPKSQKLRFLRYKILNVLNSGFLPPLIMVVMGLGVEQEERQLFEGKDVSDSSLHPPCVPVLQKAKEAFPLGAFRNGRDPLSSSHGLGWRAEAIWGLALLGCLTRTLYFSNQKLRAPIASDLHEVSDLGERPPEEWIRHTSAGISHAREKQCKNTGSPWCPLVATHSGYVRALCFLASHCSPNHLSSSSNSVTLKYPLFHTHPGHAVLQADRCGFCWKRPVPKK